MSWTRLVSRVGFGLAVGGLAAVNVTMLATARQDPQGGGDPLERVAAQKPAVAAMPQPRPASNDPFHVIDSGVRTTDAGRPKRDDAMATPPGPFELVNQGYRRVHHIETAKLTPAQATEIRAAGKAGDLRGNQRVMDTFTDYLPANWMQGVDNLPPGARVDSFGNPIVNMAASLPDWAQRDVDALRQEIANWLLHLHNLDLALAGDAAQITAIPPRATAATYTRAIEDLQTDRFESQYILGNYVGQAFVRNIDVTDIMAFDDDRFTDDVVSSIARYLHYYEGLKAHDTQQWHTPFVRAEYPATVAGLLQAHGHSMQSVLTLEPAVPEEGGIAGASGCYGQSTFPVGWTATVAGNSLWNGAVGTYDDASVDVPIGFRYYFQPCEDEDYKTQVRVSTNGYITFFTHAGGGGALNGTAFSNTSLPSTSDPDGFAAPWWDDLVVQNQGTTDEVVYKTEGSLGFRVFTVEYWSVSHFSGGAGEFYYFQVKLFENYTALQFHYDTLFSPDATVDSRTQGIENFEGTAANCSGSCSNTITGAPTTDYDIGYPQAPNDGCFSATCIEHGETLFGSTFGAGGTDLTTCVSLDFPDVWYSYHSPIAATTTVSLCSGGNGYDSSLSVFNACNGTELACNDDFCGLTSQLNFQSAANTTYLIRVSGFQESRGTFGIRVNIGSQGDTCVDPWSISIPGTGVNFYSTFDNTGCNDESSCANNDTIDEWLTWTAPSSGVARASTCAGSTAFDTTLAVYTGPCGSLTQRACNDDASPFCNAVLTSRVLWTVDAGTTYLIRVAGYNGASGEYDIDLRYSNCPADVAPPEGNGRVDVDDLVAVILGWGLCDSCRPDFAPPGGNNRVDVDDLIGVILSWGTCPP